MNVGFIGLGKLGLAFALTAESRGHTVWGCDINPDVISHVRDKNIQIDEEELQRLLKKSKIELSNLETLVEKSEIMFVAVQTPHHHSYEGISPLPEEKKDFDYSFLQQVLRDVARIISLIKAPKIVSVVSTVLPGTLREYILPTWLSILGSESQHTLVYNPAFIAMGSSIADFLNPEFVLLGRIEHSPVTALKDFYRSLHNQPIIEMSLEEAEATKVLYNTFIGLKIIFANTVMEMAHKLRGVNCDVITSALAHANQRIISARYLSGGMGDGGGCHPRDNIALSCLAERLNLSADIFSVSIKTREQQTKWLASIIQGHAERMNLPIAIYGVSYKGDCNMTTGSPALLLSYYLTELKLEHTLYDPMCSKYSISLSEIPRVIFIGARHQVWQSFQFTKDSLVIDPFRYLSENPSLRSCFYVPIGIS